MHACLVLMRVHPRLVQARLERAQARLLGRDRRLELGLEALLHDGVVHRLPPIGILAAYLAHAQLGLQVSRFHAVGERALPIDLALPHQRDLLRRELLVHVPRHRPVAREQQLLGAWDALALVDACALPLLRRAAAARAVHLERTQSGRAAAREAGSAGHWGGRAAAGCESCRWTHVGAG